MKKETRLNLFDTIVYAMMFVAVVYIIIQTILGNNGELGFKITLGLWVLGAVVISDFVDPMVRKVFDNVTFKCGLYYILYSIFDASAYMSFYIFIINIGLTKEVLHYVFLGLAVIFFVARILFRTMYENCEQGTENIEDIENIEDFEVNTMDEQDMSDIKMSAEIKDRRKDGHKTENKDDEDDMKVLIYRSRNK